MSTEKETTISNKNLDYRKLYITNVILIVLVLIFASTTVFLGYQQFFPDRRITGSNYSQVKDIIETRFLNDYPDKQKLEEGQVRGLIWSLNDPHSTYFSKSEGENFNKELNNQYVGIGISLEEYTLKPTIKKVFKNSPAQKVGLQKGDIISKLDEELTENLNNNFVISKIRGQKDTKLQLQVIRNGQTLNFSVNREEVKAEPIYLEVQKNTAIINISTFGENMDLLMQDIATEIVNNPEITQIIIDLRSNSGGLLDQAVELISYFVQPNQVIVQEKGKTESENKNLQSKTKNPSLSKYPLKVLINGSSASASEIMAAAFRELRQAKLYGQKTYGKGTVQRIFPLSDGDSIKITIAQWLTPKGEQVDKKGVSPDVEVKIYQDALKIALEE